MGAPVSDLLTVKDVEVLSKRYEVKNNASGGAGRGVRGEAEINYWKLCEQIEKVPFAPEVKLLQRRGAIAACDSGAGCVVWVKTRAFSVPR